jgi:hypothetical protein
MSDAPSWLSEENIATATKVANNPAAKAAAKNPAVQSAAKAAAKDYATNNSASWAAEDTDIEKGKKSPKNVPPPPPSSGSFSSPSSQPPMSTELEGIDPAVLKQMQNWHLVLRCAYMSCAILLATVAALSLQNQKDVGLAFFAFYVFFFAIMICCFEVGLIVSFQYLQRKLFYCIQFCKCAF